MTIIPRLRLVVAGIFLLLFHPGWAGAWGDMGHEIIGAVAQHELMRNHPVAWRKIETMLAADTDTLTPPDFPSRATWPTGMPSPIATATGSAMTRPGDGISSTWMSMRRISPRHATPPCPPASRGPADACILDKIDQFTRELSDPATPPAERLLALKFLMHFVGDVHQPLHVAEHDDDKGGNLVPVLPPSKRASESLHIYWDVDPSTASAAMPKRSPMACSIASRTKRPNGPAAR